MLYPRLFCPIANISHCLRLSFSTICLPSTLPWGCSQASSLLCQTRLLLSWQSTAFPWRIQAIQFLAQSLLTNTHTLVIALHKLGLTRYLRRALQILIRVPKPGFHFNGAPGIPITPITNNSRSHGISSVFGIYMNVFTLAWCDRDDSPLSGKERGSET